MPNIIREEHEAQGLLYLSRMKTKDMPLVGSSIEHSSVVMLEIKTAFIERELSTDWMHGDKNLIRVVMSPSQFADAITNLNNGSGTPVTIEYVIGDTALREKPSPPQTRKKFESDYRKSISNIIKELDDLLETPRLALKTRRHIEMIKTRVMSSIPFIEEQFAVQMDKTVTEAKADIEAFMMLRERNIADRALNNSETVYVLEQDDEIK